jgi:hypothetical protein
LENSHLSIRKRLAIALVTFLASMAFVGTASAQAGDPCNGGAGAGTCGLGGQIRGQIGNGLPLPISLAPGYTGAFENITINSIAPPLGVPPVGAGLGQPGEVKPIAGARISVGASCRQQSPVTDAGDKAAPLRRSAVFDRSRERECGGLRGSDGPDLRQPASRYDDTQWRHYH